MVTTYNIQYNIPRVQVQLPGRQNRLSDGVFRITPSMTEPIIFQFGNQDGVPLTLHSFKLQFVIWEFSTTLSDEPQKILLNKRIIINNPYSSQVEMLLTEDDTHLIGAHSHGRTLRWSLFLVNDEDQVFPMQISTSGGRYGTLVVDSYNALPLAEIIRTPSA